jgi:exodeoxyribonuclease VII small subunit
VPSTGGNEAEPVAAEASFEVALERLEAIVERLEGGDLALEEALASFEEGVHLSRRLADQLAAAEQRVERLVREGGTILARPLDGTDDGDSEP